MVLGVVSFYYISLNSLYECVCVCVYYVCTYVCVRTCVYVCVLVFVCVYICMYVCMYVCFLFLDINSMPHYMVIINALRNLSFSFTATFDNN